MLTARDNELLTATGPGTPMGQLMRRYWIPAFFSSELPEPDCPPVRVKLLNESLVAFRATDGQVGLLGQHCPHRGASLFFGRNEECGLRCVYHGWKFDVTGQCIDMPNEPPESNFKHKIRTTAYPCVERGGLVWTYMGPPHLQPGLPALEWAVVPESHRYGSVRLQQCNWFQAMEGGIDSSHISFLHRGDGTAKIASRLTADTAPKFEIVDTDYGFMIGARRDVEAERSYWRITQWLMPWYTMIPRAGDDVPIGAHAWVPVDDESCLAYSIEWHPDRPLSDQEMEKSRTWNYIHAENIPGSHRTVLNKDNDYLIDRALQKSGRSFTGIKGIGMQDAAIQESMGPIFDRGQEHLGTSDTAIITVRRYLLRVLKEMEEGKDPPGLNPASQRVRSAGFMLPRGVPFLEAADDYIRCKEAVYGGSP